MVLDPEDHTQWTIAQWRERCHLWRGEPSWRCLTFFTKDHALFLGITSVIVLIIVFLKDCYADHQRSGTMTKGREERPPAERPATPRASADAHAKRIKGARQVGSGLLPGFFQAKKE